MDYDRIQKIIESKGYTIKSLASQLEKKEKKISFSSLYRSIRVKSINVETLEIIANELNVPVNVFFDEDLINELDKSRDEVREYSFQIRLLLNYIYSIGIAYYEYIQSLSPEAKEEFLKTDLSRDILNSLEINKESLNDLSSWAKAISINPELRKK